ncbi:hypothetical protein Btru_031445 [Bulinus truncatus]|nr:hypothetical protein Btru_031445 [Bulinus truncatus]
MKKSELLKKYGHMFRHIDEMATTDQLISQDRVPVEETVWETNETCTVSCKPKDIFEKAISVSSESENNIGFGEPKTGKTQAQQYSFHGCCISYQHHISPDRLPNTDSKMRRLVQFKQRKQFFLQDVCRHIQNCNRGCKCMRQNIIVAALVVDDDPSLTETPSEEDTLTFANARLENIVYEGWCKCFNQSQQSENSESLRMVGFEPSSSTPAYPGLMDLTSPS